MQSSLRSSENKIGAMTDAEYVDFQRVVRELTGISLSEKKRAMLTNRLAKRMAYLNLDNYQDYLYLVKAEGHSERNEFINAVTTNLTYFFREPHHFEYFGQHVLPTLSEKIQKRRPIRVWSAGCSYGQEPYSLAIEVCNSEIDSEVRILCTDIDSETIRSVQLGAYPEKYMRGLSEQMMKNWFVQRTDGLWQAVPALRQLLIGKQLNLFEKSWPIRPGVDVIMCRNTLIYFTEPDQAKVIRGFAATQEPGAYLFLGHSEKIMEVEKFYKRVGNTIFERI